MIKVVNLGEKNFAELCMVNLIAAMCKASNGIHGSTGRSLRRWALLFTTTAMPPPVFGFALL